MSNSGQTELQILLNGKNYEPLQDEGPCGDGSEEPAPSASLDEEVKEEESDKEAQVKMQSILQQVRKQIRSQGEARAQKSSILALVQKVLEKEVETPQVNGDAAAEDGNGEQGGQEETERQKGEDVSAIFEEKLEASKRALQEEFEVQISQLRKEMQAYTDQALKELEGKMLSGKDVTSNPKEEPKQVTNKKQPSSAAPPPSVALRRGRVLARTMTTIIPKTCTPVIVGPRAKSESLTSSKARLGRDATLTSKTYQSRKPLPPAGPWQPKRPAKPKPKTGNSPET